MATKKTPAQIDAEKKDSENMNSIQPKTDVIEEPSVSPEELKKTSPVNTATPKESNRQYGKKVQDYKNVVQLAKDKNVDLDSLGYAPLTDSFKSDLKEVVRDSMGKDAVSGLKRIDTYTAPKEETAIKPDIKAQMELEKQKRKIRWADALYAFGEGLQGKTANPENFAQNRIQRKQDKQFQDFKDITNRNNKSKEAWENQTRSEVFNWIDEQSKNKALSEKEREKFNELKRQFDVAADEDSRWHDIQAKFPRGTSDKENQPIKIKTAKQTYTLKPEEAAFYAREAKKNGDLIGERFPKFWVKSQKTDKFGKPTGESTYTLRTDVSDNDLAAAWLEEQEDPQFKQFEKSKENILNNYKQRGELQPEQPKKAKADPLGLGI